MPLVCIVYFTSTTALSPPATTLRYYIMRSFVLTWLAAERCWRPFAGLPHDFKEDQHPHAGRTFTTRMEWRWRPTRSSSWWRRAMALRIWKVFLAGSRRGAAEVFASSAVSRVSQTASRRARRRQQQPATTCLWWRPCRHSSPLAAESRSRPSLAGWPPAVSWLTALLLVTVQYDVVGIIMVINDGRSYIGIIDYLGSLVGFVEINQHSHVRARIWRPSLNPHRDVSEM